MALEITYWGGTASGGVPVASTLISSETRSLSGTSAQSGATPDSATFLCITASEAARFAYDSNPTASASNSQYLASGTSFWVTARAGYKVAGITG